MCKGPEPTPPEGAWPPVLSPPLPPAPYLPSPDDLLRGIDRLAAPGAALRAADLLCELGRVGVGGGPVARGPAGGTTHSEVTHGAWARPAVRSLGAASDQGRVPVPRRTGQGSAQCHLPSLRHLVKPLPPHDQILPGRHLLASHFHGHDLGCNVVTHSSLPPVPPGPRRGPSCLLTATVHSGPEVSVCWGPVTLYSRPRAGTQLPAAGVTDGGEAGLAPTPAGQGTPSNSVGRRPESSCL